MIGIFDSGMGGLSVWREIAAQLPGESIICFSDQFHTPYGPRPLEEIRGFSESITRFLLNEGCRMVVVACNAASAASLNHLRAAFPKVPFVGMEPAVKPAAMITRTGRVGVMATPATFQGELFASVVERFGTNVQLIKQVCPGLVEQVEAGKVDSPDTDSMLRRFLAPMQEASADAIVLACTHYPFLVPAIQRIVGPGVQVIDPAPAIARQTRKVLEQKGLLNKNREIERVFYTSGNLESFRSRLKQLVGIDGPARRALWDGSQRVLTRENLKAI